MINSITPSNKDILLGILGGLGPLASAEFLKTLYEYSVGEREQDAPVCMVLSDPTLPDRTEAVVSGSDEKLLAAIEAALQKLCLLGADKIVVTCLTSHYLFPRLPFEIREKIISLVDLIIQEVHAVQTRALLLCTSGTYSAGLFKAHSAWSTVEPYIVIPTERDRGRIHKIIYEIKAQGADESTSNVLKSLLDQYQVDWCIAGCTEFHLVNKYERQKTNGTLPFNMIDPLYTLAINLKKYLYDQ